MSVQIDKSYSVRHHLRPFEPFLKEEGVTEICVNRPKEVFCEKRGIWIRHEVPELTYGLLFDLGTSIAAFSGENVTFGSTTPVLSAQLPDGERVQFVMPPACKLPHGVDTISVTIRKPSFDVRTLNDYVKDGFFSKVKPAIKFSETDQELMKIYSKIHDCPDAEFNRSNFLRRCVQLGKNIVIAGETGSGKTTFMKALMQSIPIDERIITIEDVPELLYGLPDHKNQVNLFYPSETSSKSTVTAASLMRSCLRMKPDRILLAELRGGETFDFLNVCLSGHGGSITSCHAGSCKGVFEYLALKVLQSETGKTLPYDVIKKLLYLTIDVVVHIHNDKTGGLGRHITEIWFDPSIKLSQPETEQ